MRTEELTYHLPEGKATGQGTIYEQHDRLLLGSIYRIWNTYSELLSGLNGRRANFPGILSEPIFCLELDCIKKVSLPSGYSSSFDCYDPKNKQRIQVKAASSTNELTSFGPNSVFDELYFLDFFNNGNYNGSFKIFRLGYSSSSIRKLQISHSRTFGDIASNGERPRFSIRSHIERKNLTPIVNGNLF